MDPGDPLAGYAPDWRQRAAGGTYTFLWDTVEDETIDALDAATKGLGEAGARITEVALGDEFAGLGPARHTINRVERARALAFEWNNHRQRISEKLTATLEQGLATPHAAYVSALTLAQYARGQLDRVFGACEALLAPCVPGVAPAGLSSTGDPELQGLWTILHVPTISLPTHWTKDGLPVGIQLVGRPRDDKALLEISRWALARLAAG